MYASVMIEKNKKKKTLKSQNTEPTSYKNRMQNILTQNRMSHICFRTKGDLVQLHLTIILLPEQTTRDSHVTTQNVEM